MTNLDEMFEAFRRYSPNLASDAVDYYKSGRNELTIITSDGTRIYYDNLNDSARFGFRNVKMSDLSEEEIKKEFSSRLRRKLEDNFMIQIDLVKKTGISQKSINDYIHGKSLPGTYALVKITDALKCSATDLLYFD